MAKHKHLTLDERYKIQNMLDAQESFSSIARLLGRDKSTISKEVRNHLTFKKTGALGRHFNDCTHRMSCERHYCSKGCTDCKFKVCHLCISYCKSYEKETCKRHTSKPYVCNGCKQRNRCTLEKRIYSAAYADREYKLVLRESRQGIAITEDEALALDEIISPLVKNGQSIHHICRNNADRIMHSEKTIYNYMDAGMFSAGNIDLPRKVKFKPRSAPKEPLKLDKTCRIGRTYDDFKLFLAENPDTPITQMDTVVGSRGGKCLLTIHFTTSAFMLAFLRGRNTAASIQDVIDHLYLILGYDKFAELFPVILTDNGSEFSNPTGIEVDEDGVIRTQLFYCNPSSPYQKGAIENNHEFIRRIIPKGHSFSDLTQEKVNLMMNHINSYKRKNLAWHSPYEVFELFYGRDTLDKLGAKRITSKDIILHPKLLK